MPKMLMVKKLGALLTPGKILYSNRAESRSIGKGGAQCYEIIGELLNCYAKNVARRSNTRGSPEWGVVVSVPD